MNSVNAGKHTPLHEAAYRGYDDIILELLLGGADPHAASNQKRTPLHEACIQGMLSTINSTMTLVLISLFKMIKMLCLLNILAVAKTRQDNFITFLHIT